MQQNNLVFLRISNVLSKCISLIYTIFIPGSLGLHVLMSLTDKGNTLYGYILDIVRIIVSLLFAFNLMYIYRSDEKRIKSSTFIVIYAGICLLELVFTVCLHGKYNSGGYSLLISYSLFFLFEILAESLALSVIVYDNEGIKLIWFFSNGAAILYEFLAIIRKEEVVFFLTAFILLREIVRLCLLARYVIFKKS